jgi:hypothetical protein
MVRSSLHSATRTQIRMGYPRTSSHTHTARQIRLANDFITFADVAGHADPVDLVARRANGSAGAPHAARSIDSLVSCGRSKWRSRPVLTVRRCQPTSLRQPRQGDGRRVIAAAPGYSSRDAFQNRRSRQEECSPHGFSSNERVRRDSNPQPLVPKTNALSIELRTRR